MKIETWASIRHLFHVEKLPKKAIARQLGIDPKTVRRALKQETFSRTPSEPRASKLDTFKEKIGEILNRYRTISAVRIHEEIQKLGYSGGISILRDYLRPLRTSSKTFLHIQTTPGRKLRSTGPMPAKSPPRASIVLSWFSHSAVGIGGRP